jgi:hypothetical protein
LNPKALSTRHCRKPTEKGLSIGITVARGVSGEDRKINSLRLKMRHSNLHEFPPPHTYKTTE